MLKEIGVKPNGEGAVVDEADLHFGSKRSGFNDGDVLARQLDKIPVKPFALFRRCRIYEAGPVSFFGIGQQGELRDDHDLAIDGCQIEIGFPRLSLKMRNLRIFCQSLAQLASSSSAPTPAESEIPADG